MLETGDLQFKQMQTCWISMADKGKTADCSLKDRNSERNLVWKRTTMIMILFCRCCPSDIHSKQVLSNLHSAARRGENKNTVIGCLRKTIRE